jgi:hypothetical protein
MLCIVVVSGDDTWGERVCDSHKRNYSKEL